MQWGKMEENHVKILWMIQVLILAKIFLVRYIIVYSFSERRKGSGQFSQHLYFQRPSELSQYEDKL